MTLRIIKGETYELYEKPDRWQVVVDGLTPTHVLFRYVPDHPLVAKFGANPRGARSHDHFERHASRW